MRDYFSRDTRPQPAAVSSTVLLGIVLAVLSMWACYTAYRWAKPPPPSVVAPAPAVTRPALPPALQTSPPVAAPPTASLPEGARTITKCVVNGSTSYGDQACAQGARGTQIITKANHNLLAGLTPGQMAAANAIRATAPAAPTLTNTPQASLSTASECPRIDAEIVQLDAMARQPQSGQMQDWISQRRKDLRDRQFRIRCR